MPTNKTIYATIIYNNIEDTAESIAVFDNKLVAITTAVVEVFKNYMDSELYCKYTGYVIDQYSYCQAEVNIAVDDTIYIKYEDLDIPEEVFHRIVLFAKETLDKRLGILLKKTLNTFYGA